MRYNLDVKKLSKFPRRPRVTGCRMELSSLRITQYYHRGTEPLHNIMSLGREGAFRKAAELAAAHPNTQSFYRFADFENYYPLRLAADAELYRRFTALGGRPDAEHPLSFVLFESPYLKDWFSRGASVSLPLSRIPADKISFTLGDSCSTFDREGELHPFTKEALFADISAHGGAEAYAQYVKTKCHYIEVQLWLSEDYVNLLIPPSEIKYDS